MIPSAAELAPLGLTIKVASCATSISMILGVGLGWLLARIRFWGRDWLDAAATLPLVLPPTALGYYLVVLLGGNSQIGEFLQRNFGITLMFTWHCKISALCHRGRRSELRECYPRSNEGENQPRGELLFYQTEDGRTRRPHLLLADPES
ncbi:MAG: molybdate ABC transporter permease subunit [Acidithiobacillus sp.]